MNEVNKPVFKKCSKCKELLPVAFFSKKTKSADGLQEWCKNCQSDNSKYNRVLKKENEYKRQLSKLSYYKRNHDLKYSFIGNKSKKERRKNIHFECLNCGYIMNSTIKDAIKNKFLCKRCLNPEEYKTTNIISNHKCNCKECSSECDKSKVEQKQNIKNFDLENILKQHKNNESCTAFGFNNHPIRVIMIPMYDSFGDQTKREQKKENRFIKWLKGLFNK